MKFKTHRLTYAQRKENIEKKIEAFKAGGEAIEEDEEDEE